MRTMKKLTAIFLAFCLSLLMMLPATAATAETPEMKEKRILNEVLTGEITNQEDVIQYALAQREARSQASIQTYSTEEVDTNISDDFTITQVLGETVDENGYTVKNIATSSLIVTGENGEQISATDYVYTNDSHSSTAGSSQCSVSAVFTMYVQARTPIAFKASAVRVLYTKTIVYNNGFSGASSLQQFYSVDDRPYGFSSYSHASSIIYSPSNATAYTYTPYDPSPWHENGLLETCLNCSALVKVGSVELWARCIYSLGPQGEWSPITG